MLRTKLVPIGIAVGFILADFSSAIALPVMPRSAAKAVAPDIQIVRYGHGVGIYAGRWNDGYGNYANGGSAGWGAAAEAGLAVAGLAATESVDWSGVDPAINCGPYSSYFNACFPNQ
jgi:hypothetical protein